MEHSHVGSSVIRGQQDDRPRVPLGSMVWQLLVRRGHLQTGMTLLIALGLLAVQWTNLLPTPWLDALGLTPQGRWHLAPLAVIAVAMLGKHVRPLAALLVGGACVLADLAIGGSAGIWFCLVDLIYFIGLRGERRTLTWLAGIFAVLILTPGATLLALGGDAQTVISLALLLGTVLLLPLWWSVEVRRGYPLGPLAVERDRLTEERHTALVRVHELDRRQAVTVERQRMARELHDVISSHVSAIALHSGAALTADPDAERDRRALEEVRRTSVTALEDLRSMVRLLRGEDRAEDADDSGGGGDTNGGAGGGRLGPEPRFADAEVTDENSVELLVPPSLGEVLGEARRRGLIVTVTGEVPADDAIDDRVVTRVLARVLQEALTNAAAHGDGTVQVEFTPTARLLRVQVANDLPRARLNASHRDDAGQASGASLVALATGTGLISMQERVAQAGGTLRAGLDGDCWVLTATLPRERA